MEKITSPNDRSWGKSYGYWGKIYEIKKSEIKRKKNGGEKIPQNPVGC